MARAVLIKSPHSIRDVYNPDEIPRILAALDSIFRRWKYLIYLRHRPLCVFYWVALPAKRGLKVRGNNLSN